MIQGHCLAAMLPHAGAMVLLDAIDEWDATRLRAHTRSHLCAANPLRRAGRLPAICGIEYALQAAALHGAMRAGGTAQRPGYLARLRDVVLGIEFLDDETLGALTVDATLERAEDYGMLYGLAISSHGGRLLLSANAAISLP